MAENDGSSRWTQDQAIAYESARELIGHMMAIKSEQIEQEQGKKTPDKERIEALRLERLALHQERSALHVTDDAQVARIRDDYGAVIRAYICKCANEY
jgi:hypothetical protein